MEIIINVRQDLKPKKNDVMIYDGDSWQVLPKAVVLSDELKKIREYEERIKEMESRINNLSNKVIYMAKALKENIQ